ncbi:MAG: UxaA family hydrolase [Terriglobia bacterium]
MHPECFQICREDNVATLLRDAAAMTDVRVIGEAERNTVRCIEPIRTGHKVALRPIGAGEAIVKYGFPVGEAIRQIAEGEWVHLHNCRSGSDALSSELDLRTGVRGETRYA